MKNLLFCSSSWKLVLHGINKLSVSGYMTEFWKFTDKETMNQVKNQFLNIGSWFIRQCTKKFTTVKAYQWTSERSHSHFLPIWKYHCYYCAFTMMAIFWVCLIYRLLFRRKTVSYSLHGFFSWKRYGGWSFSCRWCFCGGNYWFLSFRL